MGTGSEDFMRGSETLLSIAFNIILPTHLKVQYYPVTTQIPLFVGRFKAVWSKSQTKLLLEFGLS